jgi:UDP-N-acetyl-D-galactosamine dehydrogenase
VGPYVAQRLVKMLVNADVPVKHAKVGILGLTFKEDCNDLRNSKVPDIFHELRSFGIEPIIHDPIASAPEAVHEYGLKLSPIEEFRKLDGLVVAVSHRHYHEMGQAKLLSFVKDGGVVADVKSLLDPGKLERGIRYWSL